MRVLISLIILFLTAFACAAGLLSVMATNLTRAVIDDEPYRPVGRRWLLGGLLPLVIMGSCGIAALWSA